MKDRDDKKSPACKPLPKDVEAALTVLPREMGPGEIGGLYVFIKRRKKTIELHRPPTMIFSAYDIEDTRVEFV